MAAERQGCQPTAATSRDMGVDQYTCSGPAQAQLVRPRGACAQVRAYANMNFIEDAVLDLMSTLACAAAA